MPLVKNRVMRCCLSSLKHPDCNAALKRIAPKLGRQDLRDLVDGTPFVSDLQKEFYRTMLSERKERILDYSLDKLLTRERKQRKNAR